jgi:hypothetical protein
MWFNSRELQQLRAQWLKAPPSLMIGRFHLLRLKTETKHKS